MRRIVPSVSMTPLPKRSCVNSVIRSAKRSNTISKRRGNSVQRIETTADEAMLYHLLG
jgi:hypothetical protein